MKGMGKSTFREIKSSFGRFMAIFAIIALGVGLFAGLKVTKEAMTVTVKDYLDRHGFYDFRLLSTLGFEQEDVDFLAAQDAEAVEGAFSFDVLYHLEDDNQGVVKVHSLTQRLNTVKLISGRLPQASHECVADSNLFDESAIGSTIYLSEDNEEDTLDQFAHREYTIVGTIQSSLYVQYERGNTSLGNGRVNGFIYLPPEGFDAEYFTEIYVRFSQDYAMYSEEYESFIEEKEGVWEELTVTAADRRFQEILDEAYGELADARAEFEDEKAEGEAELADAAKTLEDARAQLADGEQALEDAKRELADGEETLREKEAELADAKATIAEKETELADGEQQLADGREEWHRNNNDVESAKVRVAENRRQLEEQAEQLAMQKEGLEAMAAAGMITQQELEAGLASIAQGEQTIAAHLNQLGEADRQFREANNELWKAWVKLEDSERELAEGRQALEDAKRDLVDGEQAIADAKADIEEAKKTLAEKEAELVDAQEEFAEGEKEYQDALAEFDEKIAEAEAELAEAEAEIDDLEGPETYVLGRNTNMGYVCFENDSDIVEGIANIFPVFFFLVAALVCVTTMNRMVEEQRTQIGVLKALGYGNGAILSKYMIYSGVAAVTGCIGGFFLGTWGFPKVIWYCYGIMYDADPIYYVFNRQLAVFSLVVSLLCSVGTTWLSCRMELGQVAASLMRPKAPRAGKRVFLEHIPFVWKRLSFLRKVSVRNIFRYKKRLIMMIMGISGCTALLVAGFGIKDSIADLGSRQFQEIQTYDIGVTFDGSVDEAAQAQLAELRTQGMEEYTCVTEENMDLVTEDGVKAVFLVIGTAGEMPYYVNLHTAEGEPVSYPGPGEAVISHKIAEDYDLQPGDAMTLRDEDMQTLTVTVSAVFENYIYNYVHICEDTWRQQRGEEPERRTAYLNLAEGTDAHELSARLVEMEQVESVTVNADTMNRIDNMLTSLNVIVLVVILCAAGLAFIVLYNLTNINITERIREIATVKVLGFYKKETSAYVFRENFMLTVLGAAVGLVLGQYLHLFIMNEIRIDMIAFNIYVKPVSYAYSAVLTFVFAWFVNRVMGGKLESVSMTESLKSVD